MTDDRPEEDDQDGPGFGIPLYDLRINCAYWVAIGIGVLAYLAPFGREAASATWTVFWVWLTVTFYHGVRRAISNSFAIPPRSLSIEEQPDPAELDYVDLPTSVPIPTPTDVAHAEKRLSVIRDAHPPRGKWLRRIAPLPQILGLPNLLRENAVSPLQFLRRLRHRGIPRIGKFDQAAREQERDTLLHMVMDRARASCRRGGHALPPGVTVGTVEASLPNAFAESWFGASPLVGTSVSLHLFCHLFAKAIAPLVAGIAKREGHSDLLLGFPGPQAFPASYRLWCLLTALILGRPQLAPYYYPDDDWPFWPLVVELRDSIELFVVGHELGHLFYENQAHALAWSKLQHEAAADEMALYIIYNDAVERKLNLGVALAAPRLFFLALGFLEDRALLPRPVDHLPSTERSARLEEAIGRVMADAGVPRPTRKRVALLSQMLGGMTLNALERVGRFLPRPRRS
jgi:hypothetical protein